MKARRNNQFSDIFKCALDDAYLNRSEMVRREERRKLGRWMRKRGWRAEEGVKGGARDLINEEKLGGKEIKEDLSWTVTSVYSALEQQLVLWGLSSKRSGQPCRSFWGLQRIVGVRAQEKAGEYWWGRWGAWGRWKSGQRLYVGPESALTITTVHLAQRLGYSAKKER